MKGAPTHIIDAEKCTGILQEMRLWPQPEAGCFNWNITSLLAQSYEPVTAAILGVYLHGLAADIALPETESVFHRFGHNQIFGKAF
jgi:hypothetical protein